MSLRVLYFPSLAFSFLCQMSIETTPPCCLQAGIKWEIGKSTVPEGNKGSPTPSTRDWAWASQPSSRSNSHKPRGIYFQFSHEETKAQRGQATLPRSHSQSEGNGGGWFSRCKYNSPCKTQLCSKTEATRKDQLSILSSLRKNFMLDASGSFNPLSVHLLNPCIGVAFQPHLKERCWAEREPSDGVTEGCGMKRQGFKSARTYHISGDQPRAERTSSQAHWQERFIPFS